MAMKNQKVAIEVLLAGAEIGGIRLQPHLVKTKRLVTVEVLLHRPKFAKTVGHVKLELRA